MLSSFFRVVLIAGVILIGASSCTTLSTLKIDVLRPAEYSVAPEILSVVVVDNALPFRDNNVHLLKARNGIVIIDTIWVDNFGEIVTSSMTKSLMENNYFDSVYYHPSALNNDFSGTQIGEIPYYHIDSLCKAYNAQAVISLESIRYQSKMDYSDLGDYYYISLDVNSFLYWKMYSADGVLLDANLQKDSIFWDNAQSDYSTSSMKIPSIRESIEVLAWHMGKNAAKRVTPYWESVNRYYFSGGNHLFLRASELQADNKWDDAARIWYNVYENGKKKQKARAAHNIALSYEVRGNFSEAIAWSDISRQLFEKLGTFEASVEEKNISKYYYIELCERYQQKKKLDAQFGLE